MAEQRGELLILLVDVGLLTHPDSWGLAPDAFVQQLLVFLKAHALLSEANHLCVMAVLPHATPVLWTPAAGGADSLGPLLVSRLSSLAAAQQAHAAADGAQQQQQQQQAQQQPEAALSAALSRALCYAARFAPAYAPSARRKARPRVLSLVVGADTPLQYIPTMNCIFAAQAAGVVLDALVLGPGDSAFLQQAAHITGGLYLRPQQPAGLLEYLLGAFSADSATRELLSIGGSNQVVDYRASCFCHKNIIDTGYICSVCLSIFCKANMKLPACPTCGSEFKRKAAAGPAASAGAKAQGAPTGAVGAADAAGAEAGGSSKEAG